MAGLDPSEAITNTNMIMYITDSVQGYDKHPFVLMPVMKNNI